MRIEVSFEDFVKKWMPTRERSEYGFFPVYAAFGEEDGQKFLKLDMICEWRLPDGKIRFLSVFFETEVERQRLLAYLRAAALKLYETIAARIDKIAAGE